MSQCNEVSMKFPRSLSSLASINTQKASLLSLPSSYLFIKRCDLVHLSIKLSRLLLQRAYSLFWIQLVWWFMENLDSIRTTKIKIFFCIFFFMTSFFFVSQLSPSCLHELPLEDVRRVFLSHTHKEFKEKESHFH